MKWEQKIPGTDRQVDGEVKHKKKIRNLSLQLSLVMFFFYNNNHTTYIKTATHKQIKSQKTPKWGKRWLKIDCIEKWRMAEQF